MDALLATVVDELLLGSEVHVEFHRRWQNLLIVGYQRLDTGHRRLSIWDIAGEEPEELLDVRADEDND
jgi:hypothetical protein